MVRPWHGSSVPQHRCLTFDVNGHDDDTRHEAMISALGESHSLFWQFIPGVRFQALCRLPKS